MEGLDLRYKGQSLSLPEGSVGPETTVTQLRAMVARAANLDTRTVRLLGLRSGRGTGAPGQAREDDDQVLVSDCLHGGGSNGRVVVMGRSLGGINDPPATTVRSSGSHSSGGPSFPAPHYRPSSPPTREPFHMFGNSSFSSSSSSSSLSLSRNANPGGPINSDTNGDGVGGGSGNGRPRAGVGLDGLLGVSASLVPVAGAGSGQGSISDAISEMKRSFRALLVVVLDGAGAVSESENGAAGAVSESENGAAGAVSESETGAGGAEERATGGGATIGDSEAEGDSETAAAQRSMWMLRNGLGTGPAAEFIARNFIVWTASVPSDPEAAAGARALLARELKCTSFPFMMLMGNIGTVSVLEVTQGEAVTKGGEIQLLSHVFAMHDNSAPLLESAQAVATASMELQAVRDEQLDAFNKAREEDMRRMSTLSSNSSGDGNDDGNGGDKTGDGDGDGNGDGDGDVVMASSGRSGSAGGEPPVATQSEHATDGGDVAKEATMSEAEALEIVAARREAAESALGPEPPVADSESSTGPDETATVALRAPDGSRVTRRVRSDATVDGIHKLALSLCEPSVGGVRLVTSFPRTVFQEGDQRTLREAGLCPAAQLFIEPI